MAAFSNQIVFQGQSMNQLILFDIPGIFGVRMVSYLRGFEAHWHGMACEDQTKHSDRESGTSIALTEECYYDMV